MTAGPVPGGVGRPTFGGWVRPRSPGLGPLGLLPTLVVFAGLVVGLLTFMLAGLVPGLVVLAAAAAGAGLTVAPGGDRPVGALVAARVGWWRSRARREHQYRAGALAAAGSSSGDGGCPLPGVLAATVALPGGDGYGTDFVVLFHRPSRLYTVVFGCRADGDSLADVDTVESLVAGWGAALAGFGHEPGLAGVSVVVDTAPDPGTRLAAEVHGRAAADSPAVARAVMTEVVGAFPASSSENTAYVAVTWTADGIAKRARKPADVVVEVGRRVPGLIAALTAAGGGTVEALTEVELAEVLRVAYDPACALTLARARIDAGDTGLTLAEAGPLAAQESWGGYRHDSGRSVSWLMTRPPHGVVHSDVLHTLLEPHPGFARKRVALLYRPHSPVRASSIAEADVATAAFGAAGVNGRTTAVSRTRVRATERAEEEVAAGAGMTRFALAVTVTIAPGADVDQATTAVENLAANARLRLRRADGAHAAAFATTLPVGFLPWLHTAVPDTVRDLLL